MIPLNPNQRANLKEQIDERIEKGIIETANSPWASPLVPVRKDEMSDRSKAFKCCHREGCLSIYNYSKKICGS